MPDPRQEIVRRSNTIVVKVGTRVLTYDDGTLDQDRVTAIAEQLVRLMEDKRHVVLVSSGAVGAGIGRLGVKQKAGDLAPLPAGVPGRAKKIILVHKTTPLNPMPPATPN